MVAGRGQTIGPAACNSSKSKPGSLVESEGGGLQEIQAFSEGTSPASAGSAALNFPSLIIALARQWLRMSTNFPRLVAGSTVTKTPPAFSTAKTLMTNSRELVR